MGSFAKRLLSLVLSLMVVVSVLTIGGNITASAAGYDPNAALTYAKAHWNDGKGDCQAFVKACLKAGGVTISSGGCYNVYKALKNGGYGTLYKLNSTGNQYKFSNNSGKVSKGDPMFFVCTTCGGTSSSSAWPHVVLCGEGSGGYITDYAHNSAHNGATHKLWKDLGHSSHPNHTMEVYSFHMNASPQTPPAQVTSISGLKSTYSVGETLSVSWPAASGATSYKVALMPTNGAYGEINNVTSTSFSKNFSKPEDYSIHVDSVNSAGTTTGLTHYFSVVCTNHVRGSYHHMDDAHPHYKYYSCSVCGAVFRTSETGYVSYCNTCNPQYTLQYDANGGSGAPDKYVGNGNVSLSTTAPSRDGYYFLGWATSSSATTAQYQPGSTFNLSSDKTLYAVWDLMDKAGPEIYDIDISYDSLESKSLNSYYVKLKAKDDSNFSLDYYSYSLANGNDDAEYSHSTLMVETEAGYSRCLAEFYLSNHNNERGNYYLIITATDEWGNTTTKSITIYVPADNQIRKITYDNNNPDEPSDPVFDYDFLSESNGITLRKSYPTRPGYIFLGWATNANAISAQYQPGDEIRPDGDLYLYAVWVYNENPAKGDINGDGIFDEVDVLKLLKYLSGSKPLSDDELYRADFNNDGLVDDSDSNGLLIALAWSKCALNYSSNGGSSSPQAQVGMGNIQLSNTIPSRNGYRFIGWSTSPTATTAQYQPGDTFSLLDKPNTYCRV